MSAPVLVCSLQGRFGNQCMTYLFCRAWAENHGYELRIDPWVGELVFDIAHPRPDGRPTIRRNETTMLKESLRPELDLEFRGYAQMQRCMVYTRAQARAWLRFQPGVARMCAALCPERDTIVCHHRKGDYVGYGYPVVDRQSFGVALAEYGFDAARAVVLSEENPTPHLGLPDELSFVPDFYRMMTARVLLRANSTFSWLAGLLGDGVVLSPVIEGLEGGKEHVCRFVPGNWPRFANLDFVSDLHVTEK